MKPRVPSLSGRAKCCMFPPPNIKSTIHLTHCRSYKPGEKPSVIFNVHGMNIGRAKKLADGSYDLLARELQLYLDPVTKQVLHTWQNPYSGQSVNGSYIPSLTSSLCYIDILLSGARRQQSSLSAFRRRSVCRSIAPRGRPHVAAVHSIVISQPSRPYWGS